MASLINLPWYSILGAAVLCLAAIAAQFAPEKFGSLWKLAWVGTAIAWGGVLMRINQLAIDYYHALMVGQIALGIFFTGNRPGSTDEKSKWNLLGIAWGFIGAALVLSVSYLQDQPWQFCLGLVIGLFLLVLCRIWFRLGPIGIQVVNTFILLLVMLPLADVLLRFRARHDMSLDPAKYYSFEAAQKNPAAYAYWVRYYGEQWDRMSRQVMTYHQDPHLPLRLIPDTHAFLFYSLISINHKGYRGPEIPDEKGNTYRIVALGESTTFGCTLNREDRPWPELLEQMIRERLHLARPVEVINAGIPAATLPGNLDRLCKEILPLKPDMIISYHGFNGFYMLEKNLPPVFGKSPPHYEHRPSKLLADFEYALKLRRYKRELMPQPPPEQPGSITPPMDSEYARCYERLIRIAETNHIQLVLANYSMAVNTNSDPALLAFYRQTSLALPNDLRANQAHSEIVQTLAKQHPEICFVDTHPALDGKHQHFIDLMHFTQSGRQLMAETFFAGISNVLTQDLCSKAGAK